MVLPGVAIFRRASPGSIGRGDGGRAYLREDGRAAHCGKPGRDDCRLGSNSLRNSGADFSADHQPGSWRQPRLLRYFQQTAGHHRMGVTRAIYPGSFDPVTLGHIDIIYRARQLFDSLIVAVAQNEAKSPLFDADERVAMIEEVVRQDPGVVVKKLGGLLVDFARAESAFVVIRGLRAVSDFEFEFQMALMNRRL